MTDPKVEVFALPDLGEGLTEAEIVEWRVAVGDVIEIDQTVVEVETAKAVVDVPCPYAGRVVALHGRAGERRPVCEPLITIESLTTGEPSGAVATGPEQDRYATYREQERAGSGNVLIGYGTGPDRPGRRRRRVLTGRPGGSGDVPADGSVAVPADAGPIRDARSAAPTTDAGGGLVISPLVRRLAREHRVDLRQLAGSGPGGIVRRADVAAVLARGAGQVIRSGQPGPAPGEPGPAVSGQPTGSGEEVIIPLRGVRRAIAEKLIRSRREIPEVTIWVDVDATGLLATRTTVNAARPDEPLGVLALLARICVHALRRFPELNSRVELERERIVQYPDVHLGIATQTDRGLVVPVIRDAQWMTARQLGAVLAETTAGARAGRLAPDRLTGGTFTLNNYGVFGVDGSTPIINHPEAALLGIGRIAEKPWVVNGELAVRKVTQLSLTFDHRVCDGAVAGGFLRLVADCVERPELLVAEL